MLKISFPYVRVSRIINASAETLWDLLTDTTRWTEWGPSIQQVQSEERHIRAGSVGRVKTVLGFWAPFVIIEWENRRHWSWRVFNIRATGHRVEAIRVLGDDRRVDAARIAPQLQVGHDHRLDGRVAGVGGFGGGLGGHGRGGGGFGGFGGGRSGGGGASGGW